jgi:two-component system chemotaxis sensor kinase CheA
MTGAAQRYFPGFHTVKGGAGFLNATELVTLCHLTENLFDRLRNEELELTPELMDIIMAATKGCVRCLASWGRWFSPNRPTRG